ncbi:MAG: hypothetical protein HZC24_08045 [Rhodocyclales bacterium]|nr:hypothetical protein [Rhodocyclales bacterium]
MHHCSSVSLKPIAFALLLFPLLAGADADLPDLGGNKSAASQTRINPGPGSLTLDRRDADSRFTAAAESAQRTGTAVGFRGALALFDGAALGGGFLGGSDKTEVFANLGLRLGDAQRLLITGAQLRQKLDIDFPSGQARADMVQNAAGAAWRLQLGAGMLDHAELNAYLARTASRDLGAVDYAVDTAALYELWSDPRRVAGGKVSGLQGRLGFVPWQGGGVKLGVGQERLRYDLLNATESHNRATASLGLEQALGAGLCLKSRSAAWPAAQARFPACAARPGG